MILRIGLRSALVARRFTSMAQRSTLLVGAFQSDEKEKPLDHSLLTKAAAELNTKTNGSLLSQLNCTKPLKTGDCRLLYGLQDKSSVAVVGLGKRGCSINKTEHLHEGQENVRRAVAAGVLALRSIGASTISIDPCGYANAAAEGATLALFKYDENKNKEKQEPKVQLQLYETEESNGGDARLWNEGTIMAESQNLARTLMEMPANLLNPGIFAKKAMELFPKGTVFDRDRAWAEQKGMSSFLSVNQGSSVPPVFLEINLPPSLDVEAAPVVLVGKGVCFDSGGISLKPSRSMDEMRGDMGGAAAVLSAAYGLHRLGKVPRRLIVLIPLVENMPSSEATHPGDIIKAMNGKTIKVDNTDAEGRLILADALTYADTFEPEHVVDVATLTGAALIALGSAASAVISNDDKLFEAIYKASVDTGDRVWRLPGYEHYSSKLKTPYADINNISPPTAGAGTCTAAAFLKEFTKSESWAHMDIAGVMLGDGEIPYLGKGMSGRSTRVLMKWLMSL